MVAGEAAAASRYRPGRDVGFAIGAFVWATGGEAVAVGDDQSPFRQRRLRSKPSQAHPTIDVRRLEDWGPLSQHEGEEWMYVLSGSIAMHTEFYVPLVMKPGDSVYIDSGMGHAMVALDDAQARILSVHARTGAPFGTEPAAI